MYAEGGEVGGEGGVVFGVGGGEGGRWMRGGDGRMRMRRRR